jgi:hypothetical protein
LTPQIIKGDSDVKKIIMVVLTLTLVLAGVSSAMAFEAHKVNVRAHVENAIVVTPDEIDMGTVFPQEWVTGFHFDIGLSQSFRLQEPVRVDTVAYTIAAHHKVDEQGEQLLPWLPGLYVNIDGAGWCPVLEPAEFCDYTTVTSDTLTLGTDPDDQVRLGLDVPVFAGYYNGALEDYLQINKPRPDGDPFPADVNEPSAILPVPGAGASVGADYGVDLWIQVTGISR